MTIININKILLLLAVLMAVVIAGGMIRTDDKKLSTLKINRINNSGSIKTKSDNGQKIKLPSINNIYEAR